MVNNPSCLTPPGEREGAAPASTQACIPESSQRAAGGTGAPAACFHWCSHREKGAERRADECIGWRGQSQDQSSPQHQCGWSAKVRIIHINTYQPSLFIMALLANHSNKSAWLRLSIKERNKVHNKSSSRVSQTHGDSHYSILWVWNPNPFQIRFYPHAYFSSWVNLTRNFCILYNMQINSLPINLLCCSSF